MIASPGATMGVDFEKRVDFDRLRTERLARARAALETSDLGALLLFDMNNIRYVTGTHIGEWARDKMARYVLLPRNGDPILWDFGSAAKNHRLYAPWLPESSWRAGVASMRGAMPPETGVTENLARKIAGELRERGLTGAPLGVDISDIPTTRALQVEGIEVQDGQQVMLNAREIKTADEIALLRHAGGMADAAYDELYRALRPGVRENDMVALVNKVLYELGSDEVEAVNAVSGERCSPHPHVFADRLIRPGDQVYFDIIHAYNGYRTCYYRTFTVGSATQAQVDAYKQCREWLDAAMEAVRPGATTRDIALLWPAAQEYGFENEEECFGLQFGHGVGLGLWERPIISRLNSLDHPAELKAGMVFALETFCPAADGHSAARIEEEVVVTETGHDVLFKFPGKELLVAGTRYYRGRRVDITGGHAAVRATDTRCPSLPEAVPYQQEEMEVSTVWTIPRGVMQCPVAPMHEDGRLDYGTYEKLIEFHIRQGTSGLAVVLHLAESLNLTMEERKELVRISVTVADGRVPVLAHVSLSGTDQSIELAQHAQKAGAAGVCSITPYYWKPPEEAVFAHFVALAESIDIPVVGYNSPIYQDGISLSPRLLRRLCERLDNFVGIKEASHNFEYIIEVLRQVRPVRPGFGIINGIEYVIPTMILGGVGTMSALGGVAPRLVNDLWAAWEAKEHDRARELQDRVSYLWQILKVGYPAAIKAAMGMMGRPVGRTRLPMLPLSEAQTATLRDQLTSLGLFETEPHGW